MAGRVTTTSLGLGYSHQELRRAWARRLAMGPVDCAFCHRPINPGDLWDLGHVDGSDRRLYSGPEHRRCNRATAGRVRAPLRSGKSREW